MNKFLTIILLSVLPAFGAPAVTFDTTSRNVQQTNLNVRVNALTNAAGTALSLAGYNASQVLVTRQAVNADVAVGAAIDATKLANGSVSNTELQLLDGITVIGDVTAAAAFSTDGLLIRADGSGKGVQNSAVTVDDSGNLSTAGTGSFGVGSASAGAIDLGEGTAPSLVANAFTLYSPVDVAVGGLAFILPGAAFSGLLEVVNSSGVMTIGQATSGTDFVAPSTTITVAGTANEITSSAGAQDLSANRTWTLSLPTALTFTGKTVTDGTFSTPTISGAIVFPDGTRQTFNPNGTTPGLNVGANAGDPSAPSDGDIWYDSTGTLLRARINGATVTLGAGGIASADVQIFTAGTNTWTKPANAKDVRVTLIGAGGGGGSGRVGLASTVRCGGGGGGSGSFSRMSFTADLLGATETVIVGFGGTGGAAQTGDSTNGISGGPGSVATSFGTWLKAGAGAGGIGGSAASGAGGATGVGEIAGVAGASASTTGLSGVAGTLTTLYSAAGGAAGAGITSAEASSNGAAGGTSGFNVLATPLAGGSAGVGAAGGNGVSATANQPQGGGGGGSGASSLAANSFAGGNGGIYGGGGGGGGAALDAVGDSGAGGNGANGIAIVVTYF